MPEIAEEMKHHEVMALKHNGGAGHAYYAVGGVQGLTLQITAKSGKSWIMRVRVAGQRKHFGLGGYPEVTLAEARIRARKVRETIKKGVKNGETVIEAWKTDVLVRSFVAEGLEQKEAWIKAYDQRQAVKDSEDEQRKRIRFSDATDKYLKEKLKEFRNETHRKQWRMTLTTYALPTIGEMYVDAITVHDIERTLKPIWETTTETASRLRGRIENVLAWATVKNFRTGDNPARWKNNLDQIMPKPSKVAKKSKQPALQLNDAQAWWRALRNREGIGARAVEFLTLCASRSGEVRGAKWSEIDLEAGMWIIPADRMKVGQDTNGKQLPPHRVPLSPAAVELLNALPRLVESPYVFFGARGGMLSDMTLSKVLRDMHAAAVQLGGKGWVDPHMRDAAGEPRSIVPHGLRSTFKDWAIERTEYPSEMSEIALAHRVGGEVERAYRRGDMVEKRRALMVDWAEFLDG
ncbi:MAG: integrase [Paracoccus denitrificans]|nr:MAG: integrase [Paracoccus denitrificans]PZO84549.1 MAG: integrase [Paracoccus denitrificans]